MPKAKSKSRLKSTLDWSVDLMRAHKIIVTAGGLIVAGASGAFAIDVWKESINASAALGIATVANRLTDVEKDLGKQIDERVTRKQFWEQVNKLREEQRAHERHHP
jgi:hypothetical protein